MKIQPTIENIPSKYVGKDKDTKRVFILCGNGIEYSVSADAWKSNKERKFALADVMLVNASGRELKRKAKGKPEWVKLELPAEFLPAGTGARV